MSEPDSAATVSPDEARITLGLLSAVEANSYVTQRSVARELGIALGLANTYLRRCVRKGLVKVTAAPANRFLYYLTPKGFAEKSVLTAHYLSHSVDFFRRSRSQYDRLFAVCEEAGWRRVALVGAGDLAEIAVICSYGRDIDPVGIVDPESAAVSQVGLPVVTRLKDLGAIQAVIVTNLRAPQQTYDVLCDILPQERILAPPLLNISRTKPRLVE